MPRVPVLGRLFWNEYLALFGSLIFIFLEGFLHLITSSLPAPIISFFYRQSKRLFNIFSTPQVLANQQEVSVSIAKAPDFVDLCALFGYEAEEHIVQTGDGYLLGLHRISCRKSERGTKVNSGEGSIQKRVVYLHHGLLMNSEVWVCLTDEERCLPFRLVEQGYDVWLGNNRGNKYSKKSTTHSPSSTAFWNFSMDQFAFHDIPDSIDYILSVTSQTSLSYVGFSQGTAQAFATLSIHPGLNQKVNVFIGLAPAMSPAGLHNGVVDSLIKASPDVLFLAFGRRSILSSATMCKRYYTRRYSTKSVVHWFQIIRNRSFQMYDDDVGPTLNIGGVARYYKPAKFPTKNIRTPIVLVYGGSDSLVDISVMLKELPNHTVATSIPHYEHLDFLWAEDVNELVFPWIFGALRDYGPDGQNSLVGSKYVNGTNQIDDFE
ncbi:lysosomal acid lipase/cholesteryl ester hydrolase [Coccidioides immitis H538.4]|uniref:Lysosomal acid lipase/cholesteryl ester hydrolase n=1 Tax=Coccidioides immitis H538.4 TaxID=396776 RepID=A0A0J8RFI2_COCIT|nr:lysosomal acid lipase/cholesteryl ester hydrolase [Coccidioides immitis H538.4]